MNYFLLVPGILTLVIVVYDLIYTTLAPNGAGIISGRVSKEVWNLFLWLSGKDGYKKILDYAGMSIAFVLLLSWVLFIWLGNSLILCSDINSVINNASGNDADVMEKIYYAGYTISSLGNGEFIPSNGFWQIYGAFISLFGLIFVTIAITYLVPVLSAEIDKRQLSIYIATLGCSPQEILINGWNGNNFKRLERHFEALSKMIMKHGQGHLAYPILHYFHNTDKKASAIIQLTNLDEALTILLLYIPEANRPGKEDVYPLRKAITSYLVTLRSVFINPSDNLPRPPGLDKLKKMGIPLILPETKEEELNNLKERRKLLLGLLESDGWNWSDRYVEPFDSHLKL